MRSQVSIVKCQTYHPEKLYACVRKALDLLGGIGQFIKPGDKVLIKPNLLSAATPEMGIDTHPEFVRAVIKILKETRAELFLGDAPSVWGDPQDVENVYEKSGVKKVADEEGVTLVKFNKSIVRGGYAFTDWIEKCNRVVSLPKFKTHDLMTLTGAVKNLFGLIPGVLKTELHRKALRSDEFGKVLADIYALAKPTISIIDGVVAMEGDGPASGGTLRDLGLILAGADGVALDSVMAAIMGLKPDDIISTREAARRGLGINNLAAIDIVGERIDEVVVKDYKLPQTSVLNKIPKPFLEIGKKLINFRPRTQHAKCTACGLCIQGCPVKAISLKHGKVYIDYSKCVLCMCCKEICPQGAVVIEKSLVAKMTGPIIRFAKAVTALFS